MARPRLRTRDDILQSALKLYWRLGPTGVTVQALEVETGVNKSGLYAEFKDKDALFVATVKFYAEAAEKNFYTLLAERPLGLQNIQRFLKAGLTSSPEAGCFLTNCLRDFNLLPLAAKKIVRSHFAHLRELFINNLSADLEEVEAIEKADLLLIFDQGICLRAFAGEESKVLEMAIDSMLKRL